MRKHLYNSTFREMLKLIVKIAGFSLLMLLLLYVAGDAATRLSLSDTPRAISMHDAAESDRAVVYIGGAGASPEAQSVGILASSLKGDVYVVENATDLFKAEAVIILTIETIRNYREVTFIGGSMGGLLAYDVIKTLREQGDQRHFGVVLIDAPTGRDDVKGVPGIAKAFSWIPLGAITNAWFHPPFNRDAPAVIDADADREKLEALWRSYETWKASSWADQGKYVFFHEPLEKLSGITWYFIQSGSDDFVDGDKAYATWTATQGEMPREVVPEGEHLALLNRPKLYSAAVKNGINHVSKM